jgi:hypothetical protein
LSGLGAALPARAVAEEIRMDGTPRTYVKSMIEMLSSVTTPYVMLNDNDDFPYFPGVADAVALAESRPNLDWIGGQIGHFHRPPIGTPFFLRDKSGRSIRTIREKMSGRYQYEWYNIFRTPAIVEIFEKLDQCYPDRWTHPELFQTLFSSLLSGIFLDRYVYFREVLVKNSSDSLNTSVVEKGDFPRAMCLSLKKRSRSEENWSEIADLIVQYLSRYPNRKKMVFKLAIQTGLNCFGILDSIDSSAGGNVAAREADFIAARGLLNEFLAGTY